MKKKLFAFVSVLMLAVMLMGCGGPKTLESYYNQPIRKAAIEAECKEMLEQQKGTYSEVSMTFEGNTATYSYTYCEDPGMTNKAAYDAFMKSSLDSSSHSIIEGIRQESGVSADTVITVVFVFNNPDGSEYSSFTYSE